MTDQATETPMKAKRKRHRRWPWVLLTIFLLIVLAAWLGVGAFADSFIANNGKDSLPVGPCPYTQCSTVTYSAGLQAWYAAPAAGKSVVVIVHGYGANRTDHAQVGVALQHLGYGVMSIDLGYETATMHYGGGVREANDVVAAAAYAHLKSGKAVFLLGYSAGGTSSVLAAAQSGQIVAVVADSAPVSFIHLATDRLGAPTWVFSAAPMLYSFFSKGATLGTLETLPANYATPTLVIQGTADKTVNFDNGPAVAKLTHGQLWTIAGGTHTSAAATCPSQYITQLNAFFEAAATPGAHSFTVNQGC